MSAARILVFLIDRGLGTDVLELLARKSDDENMHDVMLSMRLPSNKRRKAGSL